MFRLFRSRSPVPYAWRADAASTITDAAIPTPAIEITLPRLDERASIRFYRPELDALRFFAFFAVFFHHTATYMPQFFAKHHIPELLGVLENSFAKAGGFGVDLFFVLSAYLITELLLREKDRRGVLDIPSFYVRRILRIWPLYYCFVALVAAVPALHASDHFSSRYLVPFLFLLGNWGCVAFGFPPHSVCGLLWSVCVEEQFYFLWPPLVSRLSRRKLVFAAIGMIVIANLARALALSAHAHYPQVWCNTLARLDPIAVGVLVAVLLGGDLPQFGRAERFTFLVLGLIGLVLVGGYADLASEAPPSPWAGTMLGYPAVAIACALILLSFLGSQSRFTRLPALIYLGRISYGLYVYHLLAVWIADRVLVMPSSMWRGGFRFVLAFGITVSLAAISYRFLETPFLNLKRQFTYVPSRPV